MKFILTFILGTSLVFAGSKKPETKEYAQTKENVLSIVGEEIGKDNTCLDEFIQREGHLKRWLIWTPPLGIVATPVTTAVGAGTAGAITYMAGVTGWAELGWVIGGAMLGLGVGTIGTLGITSVSGVKFYNNRQMIHLVVESHQKDDYDFKKLKYFYQKYKAIWPEDKISMLEFKSIVNHLDETAVLCNGELRGTDMNYKLKYRIARKWDLLNYIHDSYGAN